MIEKHLVVSVHRGLCEYLNRLLDNGAEIVNTWTVGDRLYFHLTMWVPEPVEENEDDS